MNRSFSRPRIRDLLLTAVPASLLAALMAFRGDVTRVASGPPPDSLRAHYASLLASGHVPFGFFLGFLLLLLAGIGLLGLLGDSPLDVRGDEIATVSAERRPFWRREGAWLVAGCAALYLPLAGAYGLWDPWETHYAEVAREVLARDDWVTLWWGQEGWFMSKPVLVFWLAALGMNAGSAFGVSFLPDHGPGAHEWFIRVPIALLAIGAVYALYRAVRAAFGPRPALCVGIVLATSPQWFLLAHQAMTDMPFVAPMVCAMAFAMIAVISPQDSLVEARVFNVGRRAFRLSAWHATVLSVVLVALPQGVYLLTRPLVTHCPPGDSVCHTALAAARVGSIQLPVERFAYGSAGNSVPWNALASVPGSPAWEDRYATAPWFPSPVQGILWLGLLGILLYSLRRERRQQALCFTAAYLCSALSFLGKGPAGIGLPELVVLVFTLVAWRGSLLKRVQLVRGVLVFAVCGLPWYVAICARLGNEFFDRFVVHDLFNRAFAGVHGDTGTVRYFVAQLGYGLFPWAGLLPAVLFAPRLCLPREVSQPQRDVVTMALIWFGLTFTLFSLMVTKFHHYILPAVPAAAVPVGLILHRLLTARPDERKLLARVGLGAFVVLGAMALDFAYNGSGRPAGAERLIHLFTYNYERAFPAGALNYGRVLTGFALTAAVLALAFAWPRAQRYAAAGITMLAVCLSIWALDAYIPALSDHWSQRGLFERYYALRSGPEEPLAAYQMNWKGENFYTGNHAAMLECGLPLCRESARDWLGEHRGTRVFLVTERGRESALESLVRAVGGHARALSTEEDNNHFVLLEARM